MVHDADMEIAAGIAFVSTILATVGALTLGAKFPGASWFDGSRNMPTELEVDKLCDRAARRAAYGVEDPDWLDHYSDDPAYLRDHLTVGEAAAMRSMPDAVSEERVEAAPRYLPGTHDENILDGHEKSGDRHGVLPAREPLSGWRGWLAGGYNMPTEQEIENAPPRTLRGRHRGPIPDGWIFPDEDPTAYAESVRILDRARSARGH